MVNVRVMAENDLAEVMNDWVDNIVAVVRCLQNLRRMKFVRRKYILCELSKFTAIERCIV